jgi:hypothetical protein
MLRDWLVVTPRTIGLAPFEDPPEGRHIGPHLFVTQAQPQQPHIKAEVLRVQRRGRLN